MPPSAISRIRSAFLPALLAVFALLTAAPAMAQTESWGFENPVLGPPFYLYDPAFSGAAQPWTFAGDAGIAIAAGGGFVPAGPEDGQYAFLQTNGPSGVNGSFSQSVTFSDAGVYVLSYTVGGRVGGAAYSGNATYSVTIDHGVLSETGQTSTAQPFTPVAYTFTIPAAGAYTLTFACTGHVGSIIDATAFIDDVSIAYAPLNTAPSFLLAGTLHRAGETWTVRASSQSWVSVASSADGSRLIAADGSGVGKLWTSSDFGVTWTAQGSVQPWVSVASSADGRKLVAASSGDISGSIYTSTDFGVTWTVRSPEAVWRAVASSADGTKLVAAATDIDYIYTSADSGATWTQQTGSGASYWSCVASSADGVTLLAGQNPGFISTSSNSGATWTNGFISSIWTGIVCTPDAAHQAAVTNESFYYDSAAFSAGLPSTAPYSGAAISADGSRVALTVNGGQVYTMLDYFSTDPTAASFVAGATNRSWTGIAGSSDGSRLAAVATGDQIYTSADYTVPDAVTAVGGSGLTTIPNYAANIVAGPASESGQIVTFTVTNDNNALFTTQPAIDTNGALTFQPGAMGGAATVMVVAHDDGGTVNGGMDTSPAQTFTIIVTAPAIAVEQPVGTNLVSGSPMPIDFGLANSSGGVSKTFTITNAGNADLTGLGITIDGMAAADFSVTASLTAPVAAGGSTTFTVTFAPAMAGGRSAVLHIASNDPSQSSFDIALIGTGNASPLLTLPTSPVIAEATSSAGAVVNFTVTTNDAEDGPLTPSVAPASGSVFAIGDTPVNVSVTDSNGATTTGSFIVRVQDTTPPVVVAPANVTIATMSLAGAAVTYDAATATDAVGVTSLTYSQASGTIFHLGQTIVTATARDAAGNSAAATFTVTVVLADANLSYLSVGNVPLAPAFDPAVTSYTARVSNATTSTFVGAMPDAMMASVLVTPSNPIPLVVGNNVISVQVTAPDGTTTKTYTITVNRSVPDTVKPVVAITAPAASTATGPFTIQGTVTELVDLASLTVTFNGAPLPLDTPLSATAGVKIPWSVSNVTPENGPNTIVVEAVDFNGNRGVATKTITYVNNRPQLAGSYSALLVLSGAPDIDTSGLVSLTVTATGAFTGKVMISGATVSFTGMLNNAAVARFKPTLQTSFEVIGQTEFSSDLGVLAFSVSNPAGLSGTLSTQAGAPPLATFAGQAAVSSAPSTVGRYSVVFPSNVVAGGDPKSGGGGTMYPAGDGFASLMVSSAGNVTLAGYLADGSAYAASGKLRSDGSVPLFTQLYAKAGAFAGEFDFASLTDSDVRGMNWLWLRPAHARSQYYPAGWPNGILINPIGTRYAGKASLDFGQGAANLVSGNMNLVLTDNALFGAITERASIDPVTGAVKGIPATGSACTLALGSSTGLFSGAFVPYGGTSTAFRGIVLNKGANRGGFGYFLSTPPVGYGATGQGGNVTLAP